MATLTERTEAVEERTDRLETIFAAFMARTDESLDRLERIVERAEQEGAREREEMKRQAARNWEEAAREREEMKRQAARNWEEAARERKEMNERWSNLAKKMGTLVEDIVAPSVRRLAREVFGCGEVRYFGTRVSVTRSDDRSREREFDALYVGARAVLLNETKSTPHPEDARAFAQFVESGDFARYYPQYGELPVVPAFSSLSIGEDLVKYLTRRGIYAIAMGDEAMQVLNLEGVLSRRAAR